MKTMIPFLLVLACLPACGAPFGPALFDDGAAGAIGVDPGSAGQAGAPDLGAAGSAGEGGDPTVSEGGSGSVAGTVTMGGASAGGAAPSGGSSNGGAAAGGAPAQGGSSGLAGAGGHPMGGAGSAGAGGAPALGCASADWVSGSAYPIGAQAVHLCQNMGSSAESCQVGRKYAWTCSGASCAVYAPGADGWWANWTVAERCD